MGAAWPGRGLGCVCAGHNPGRRQTGKGLGRQEDDLYREGMLHSLPPQGKHPKTRALLTAHSSRPRWSCTPNPPLPGNAGPSASSLGSGEGVAGGPRPSQVQDPPPTTETQGRLSVAQSHHPSGRSAPASRGEQGCHGNSARPPSWDLRRTGQERARLGGSVPVAAHPRLTLTSPAFSDLSGLLEAGHGPVSPLPKFLP